MVVVLGGLEGGSQWTRGSGVEWRLWGGRVEVVMGERERPVFRVVVVRLEGEGALHLWGGGFTGLVDFWISSASSHSVFYWPGSDTWDIVCLSLFRL